MTVWRNYRFVKPRFVPLMTTLCACTLFFTLGVWQLQRLHWKEGIIAGVDYSFSHEPVPIDAFLQGNQTPAEFTRVTFRAGEILPLEIHMAARYRHTVLGYEIVVPMTYLLASKERDGEEKPTIAFINLGWVPADQKKTSREDYYHFLSGKTLTGMIRSSNQKATFIPANQPERNLWFWYELDAMRAQLPKNYTGYNVFPYIVQELKPEGALPASAPVAFSPADIHIRNDHLQYAITWFLLTIACLSVSMIYHLRRKEELSS